MWWFQVGEWRGERERERCLKIGISMLMRRLVIVIWGDLIIFRRKQLIQQKKWVGLSQRKKNGKRRPKIILIKVIKKKDIN